MEKDQNKKVSQPDEDIQKNAYALGNAKVSNDDPDGITREERTRQYGETDNEFNKLDDRSVKPGTTRNDL